MNNSHYHKEIDGLRAISVLAIIFFHLKMAGFQGGFIGVDIFFVVSGYLITQIIVSNLDRGEFTFKDFYIRRSTRILPALVTTILLILPVAIYLQQPEALILTAKESIYALLSLSNFYFWTEASYWAPSAGKYVLLHTWSLGVEEQFYLIYPLLLVICHRLVGANGVIALLFSIVVLGVIASEAVLKIDRSAAFYFTPLRFYEFALGGLAATLPRFKALQSSSRISGVATLVGLTLILYGSIRFNGFVALPGITILVPLLGALLILLAGPSPSARILLMNPVMSWLGKISYSLYLTHWPIIVFYRYYFGSSLSITEQFVLFIVILGAGAWLNQSVERKFRLTHGGTATVSGLSSKSVLLGTFAVATAITVICTLLIANKGWSSRMPEGAQALMDIKPRQDTRKRMKFLEENCLPRGEIFCGERQSEKINILLLGDSRVLDIYSALKVAYPEASIKTSYALGCPPVFSPEIGQSPFFPTCPQFNQKRLRVALNAPSEDTIFLAASLSEWRSEAVRETVERLIEAGKTVYLLGQSNFLDGRGPIEISIDLLRFDPQDRDLEKYIVEEPFKLDGSYASDINRLGAVYISNRDFYFDGEYHFTDRETGKLLTFDGTHLNAFGAERFGMYLRENYPIPQPRQQGSEK